MILLASLACSTAAAQELSIPHERYTLDNGLEVVLAPDRSTPIVHTQIWYHVGSKDETKGLTGFAHLFEHLMFQGSLNSPGEYFTPIQQVGGNLNGTTNTDRTNYFETVPSQFLPLALFMESDRMGNLLQVLDQGKLDNQREVVRNERRQRYENPPYGDAFARLMTLVVPEGHPYYHPTIGSHEDLEAANLDDVKNFFRTWYGPNNATLVVTGDFEMDQAKALVEQNFGWIPAGPEPVHNIPERALITEDIVSVVEKDVPEKRLWMAWESPAFFAEGDADLDMVSSLLCDGQDSRLVKSIVQEQKLATRISCGQYSRMLGSLFLVTATAADGHTTQEISAAVQAELDKLMGDAPPTQEELNAGIADFEVGFYRQMETISGKAGMISRYLSYVGESDYVQKDFDRYTAITLESAAEVAKQTFGAPHAELHMVPEEVSQ